MKENINKTVDEVVEEMRARNKGRYITQGVSFNKNCPRQMELLKYVLSHSISFSGAMKQVIAEKMQENKERIEEQNKVNIDEEMKKKLKDWLNV